jgi:hypothetical protein
VGKLGVGGSVGVAIGSVGVGTGRVGVGTGSVGVGTGSVGVGTGSVGVGEGPDPLGLEPADGVAPGRGDGELAWSREASAVMSGNSGASRCGLSAR